MLLIAMLIPTVAMVTVRAGQPPLGSGPTVWLDDAAAQFETDDNATCDDAYNFNVTANLYNVSNVGAFDVRFSYNTNLLDAVFVYRDCFPLTISGSWAPIDGSVWHPDGPPTINETLGRIWSAATFTTAYTGNVSLYTVEFHVTHAPTRVIGTKVWDSCDLDIFYAELTDATSGLNQTFAVQDGLYNYTRGAIVPGKPKAEFLYPSSVEVCKQGTVTDVSTPNGGNIVNRTWTIANVSGSAHWVTADNMTTRTFHCDGVGTITITLNVTDDQGMWDDISHDILQYEVVGPNIDLYDGSWRQYPEGTWTPYNGTGPNEPSDAYAPGENVSLFAIVTYNKEIVQNILVGFEVLDPLGRCVTYRTDRTNETGIAHVWFRIPIPCSPAEQLELFGHWDVIAKCKLQDEIINDTKSFKVGWIVEILEVKTQPYSTWYKCEYIEFNVTVKNIAWLERLVWMTIVVYDECDVPIGQVVWNFTIEAAPHYLCSNFTTTQIRSLHVEKWAYVGMGMVYANAYTALPFDCGIPYCPEKSYEIYIEKGTR